MKLLVTRNGGLAGLKRRGERDGADLSPDQRAALDKVVRDFGQPGSPAPPTDPGADRFTYRLDIQDEGGTRSISLPESKMPMELKSIVTQ
jgi:hypothetical protein